MSLAFHRSGYEAVFQWLGGSGCVPALFIQIGQQATHTLTAPDLMAPGLVVLFLGHRQTLSYLDVFLQAYSSDCLGSLLTL